MEEVRKVDKVFSRFHTHSGTKTNELFYTGAAVVTNRVEVKKEGVRKEPMWKSRLEGKIKELRKDLSRLETLRSEGIIKARFNETLERKL